jgi:hypothetical protein
MVAIAASAHGQRKIVTSQIGVLFRYNGDTIWHERDSTVRRTIFRGDTISNEQSVAGRLRYAQTFLVSGDSARLISVVDSTGATRTPVTRSLPARMASSSRDMLAMEMRRLQVRPGYVRPTDPPRAPSSPFSYCIDGTRTLIQHVDTVRDVRKGPGRTDTTIYVFGSDTTVTRLSPSPAILGYSMYNTLWGEMHMSLVRKSLASRDGPPKDLPGRSLDACNPG